MVSLSITDLFVPLHFLTYSTLLGTQLFQTFVVVKISYQALPRSAFTTLQKRMFPVYFRTQSLLLVLAAATFPPYGPASLVKEKGNWIAFLVAGLTAGLNLILYGPRTRSVMIERIHQETRDSRHQKSTSGAMAKLNRLFARNHAMSIHLNLLTIGATLWYGWRMASALSAVSR
ncbi:hypothetical protein BDV95DRAFT_582232 [Massariosphaeria phaeospora]|uniref:TMEM205-like domain-containing protein n=1 Tax=Massariosphaeria phaeospora TaxID=100035 RepID=A0A7C8I2D1_9PLEO|nr:hypothetical protein BDV95DRAFT_582232 [Massariosphaeria phaeospora]